MINPSVDLDLVDEWKIKHNYGSVHLVLGWNQAFLWRDSARLPITDALHLISTLDSSEWAA